jgi:endonuclease III related protein
MAEIKNIYDLFLKTYGPQGWWPVSAITENNGYHNGSYCIPETEGQRFEIITGAVLTQNTSWKNVRTAIDNLHKNNLMDPEKIINQSHEKLAEVIRPSGYFNQKSRKLKKVSQFILKGNYLNGRVPDRKGLLDVWGIGPETADSILLYVYRIPVFVVDAYTKRIFSRVGIIDENYSYDDIQKKFTDEYSGMEKNKKIIIFNEYHALIVKHAKEYCRKKPVCKGCPVSETCRFLF